VAGIVINVCTAIGLAVTIPYWEILGILKP